MARVAVTISLSDDEGERPGTVRTNNRFWNSLGGV